MNIEVPFIHAELTDISQLGRQVTAALANQLLRTTRVRCVELTQQCRNRQAAIIRCTRAKMARARLQAVQLQSLTKAGAVFNAMKDDYEKVLGSLHADALQLALSLATKVLETELQSSVEAWQKKLDRLMNLHQLEVTQVTLHPDDHQIFAKQLSLAYEIPIGQNPEQPRYSLRLTLTHGILLYCWTAELIHQSPGLIEELRASASDHVRRLGRTIMESELP